MKKFGFPHPLVLLMAFILICALLSYIIPSGQYERIEDEATGRNIVVSGSYKRVPPSPVGFFEAIVAIPRGMIEASDVIFLVFLIGGAFTVVDRTKALKKGVSFLTSNFKGKESYIIIIISIAFATGGVLENMQEEIIALIPVLLILTNSLGFKPMVTLSMSVGPAFIGSSFSPINPFQVGIAQKIAELPLLSGSGFRMIFLAIALAIWIFWTLKYAYKTKTDPTKQNNDGLVEEFDFRSYLILGLVILTFGLITFGILKLHWGFNQLSAAFFIMGIVVGLVGKLGINGTANAFISGFREMTYAALLIGFARAIYVVLEDGRIIDTIVYSIFTPIESLPVQLSAIGMMVAHAFIHIPVPSVSGQAVLTMPLLIPLSDLIGLSRQVAVLAYQFGAGLTDLVTPTNGALMALLAAAGVNYDDWFKFVIKKYLILLGLGALAMVIAIKIGLQ